MKNKKLSVILIILLLIISIFIGIIFTYFTRNLETGILLSFGWGGGCHGEYGGFPVFLRSWPSEGMMRWGVLCAQGSMNPFAILFNIFFYSFLTLLVFYIIKKLFWRIRKTK